MSNTAIKNRNDSYHNIYKIGDKQYQVLEAIRLKEPATAQEIASFLNTSINQVTGRISELREDYVLIKESGSKLSETSNKMCTAYVYISNKEERLHLIRDKYRELINKRDQLVSDFHNKVSKYTKSILEKELIKINTKIEQISKL